MYGPPLQVADRVYAVLDRTDAVAVADPHPHDEVWAQQMPPWRAQEYLAVRGLLRRLLSDLDLASGDSAIATRPSGQPYLFNHPDLGVSMSHTRGWVAAAVAIGTEVGVDVQAPERVSDGLVRRCCAPATQERLETLPIVERDIEFAWIWSAQEACVKAQGSGLAGRPWTVPVDVGQHDGSWSGYRWHALRGQSDTPLSVAYQLTTAGSGAVM